jgi:riboflavin synthase alpha subunit
MRRRIDLSFAITTIIRISPVFCNVPSFCNIGISVATTGACVTVHRITTKAYPQITQIFTDSKSRQLFSSTSLGSDEI